MSFDKVLIANRGEIACRIAATARKMGIRTIAVYSEADAQARHVQACDEAILIGGPEPKDSYLRADVILEAARRSGAQAIHPGYGFLSENAPFAQACGDAGLVFIGPPAQSIAAMGSKSAAKALMDKAHVPLVPGYYGDQQEAVFLQEQARKIGYPVLIKASAGGGGKGMRIVESDDAFAAALASCQREAASSFGNPQVLVERYLQKPRHIEIQVFADQHGQCVYLFERDCSVQRRFQKVIEEAPAPGMTPERRAAMGQAAVAAAQAVGYVGAGTVEFIAEPDGQFYFMEMNTRLQVEHPVTEMVTGQDLVEWQLKIAWGDPLPLEQAQVTTHGHALEARIYAEDPDQDFLPATGHLRYLRTPAETDYVRVDTGVTEGDDISIHYDPMIAKLIVWGSDRGQAINRMVQALEHYRIAGVKTNIRFLHTLVDTQAFRNADLTTGFIDDHSDLLFPKTRLNAHKALVLAAGFILETRKHSAPTPTDPWSPFGKSNGWRMNSEYIQPLRLQVGEDLHELNVLERNGHYQVQIDDSTYQLDAKRVDDTLQAVVDGHRMSVHGNLHKGQLVLFYGGDTFNCTVYQDAYGLEDMAGEGSLAAPMNGAIVTVQAKVGDKVTAGDTLVIMEAMKMEHAIKAPADGVVSDIFFTEGDQVPEGVELIAVTVDEKEAG
jgi:3-methylcrotonyl-CoA carboxylase alpha subunit